MAARGQPVGDLLVAGPLAFEQHPVEIEDQGVEAHALDDPELEQKDGAPFAVDLISSRIDAVPD